jgi:hypothetical protein
MSAELSRALLGLLILQIEGLFQCSGFVVHLTFMKHDLHLNLGPRVSAVTSGNFQLILGSYSVPR